MPAHFFLAYSDTVDGRQVDYPAASELTFVIGSLTIKMGAGSLKRENWFFTDKANPTDGLALCLAECSPTPPSISWEQLEMAVKENGSLPFTMFSYSDGVDLDQTGGTAHVRADGQLQHTGSTTNGNCGGMLKRTQAGDSTACGYIGMHTHTEGGLKNAAINVASPFSAELLTFLGKQGSAGAGSQ